MPKAGILVPFNDPAAFVDSVDHMQKRLNSKIVGMILKFEYKDLGSSGASLPSGCLFGNSKHGGLLIGLIFQREPSLSIL